MLESTSALETSAIVGAVSAGAIVAGKELVALWLRRRGGLAPKVGAAVAAAAQPLVTAAAPEFAGIIPKTATEALASVAAPRTEATPAAAAPQPTAQAISPTSQAGTMDRRRADALRDLHEALIPVEESLEALAQRSNSLGDATQLSQVAQNLTASQSFYSRLKSNRLWLSNEASRMADGVALNHEQLSAAYDATLEALRTGSGLAGALQVLSQRVKSEAGGLSELRSQLEAEFRSTVGIS
jgi:hypothetical protein